MTYETKEQLMFADHIHTYIWISAGHFIRSSFFKEREKIVFDRLVIFLPVFSTLFIES